MYEDIERYWQEMMAAMQATPLVLLRRAAQLLLDCHGRGGTVFVVGNGGSASTSSHFACDLAKNTRADGVAPFRVMPLTDNMALMTAWANDRSYDRVFAEQLQPLVQEGDVLVAISASGNSANVLAAADVALEAGATVVALTGRTGGRLHELSHIAVRIPSDRIEQVEDAHLMIGHSLCIALREQLRAQSGRATRILATGQHDEPLAANLR